MVDFGYILMSSMTSFDMLSAASPHDELRLPLADELLSVGKGMRENLSKNTKNNT